jgi:type I protein arginine methyltransferase
MLKDRVRTLSYRDAILQNKHLFKDKVVLDVGCGTGILSMFASKAGAKLVIGVDMSDMIDSARDIVAENGFGEDKIVLLKGKMEEVVLPVSQVDIIISEWMGYCLLYESMLDTVLAARDRYLAPDGLLFPDEATLYVAALEDGAYKEEKIHFWENVYGFRMSCIQARVQQEPLVDIVPPERVASSASPFLRLDLKRITKADLSFENAPFQVALTRDDYIHAFVLFFDVRFTACHVPIRLPTGPMDTPTHWKQTVLYLRDVLLGRKGDQVHGTIGIRPSTTTCANLLPYFIP